MDKSGCGSCKFFFRTRQYSWVECEKKRPGGIIMYHNKFKDVTGHNTINILTQYQLPMHPNSLELTTNYKGIYKKLSLFVVVFRSF